MTTPACDLCRDVAAEECDAIFVTTGEALDAETVAIDNCTHAEQAAA